jgi:nitroreductase
MDLRETIYTRRSVREFTEQPVDDDVLRQLIDAAIQAPSAVNAQPWLFCVVRDKGLLARISREAKAAMLESGPAGSAPHDFRQLLANPDFDIFYHAPALIVISSASEGPWAVENCALAAENLMLAARAAGMGTCWIGFAQGWLGTAHGKAALGLPPACRPVAPIIVGYPKSRPTPVPRTEPNISWINA